MLFLLRAAFLLNCPSISGKEIARVPVKYHDFALLETEYLRLRL
jgi:hypothetical protein